MRITLNKILAFIIFILGIVLFLQVTEIDLTFWHYFERAPKLTVDKPEIESLAVENFTFQQYLDKGDKLIAQNLLELAVAYYARAAILEPESVVPQLRIATAYFEQGEFSRAVQNSQRILKQKPDSIMARTILVKSYLAAGNLNEAQRVAMGIENPGAEGSYFRGLLAAIAGDRETAGQFLHRTVQLAQENPTVENKFWADKAQRLISAYHNYDEYRDSPNPYFQALLTQALIDNDQPQLALAQVKNLVNDYPEYRDAWVMRGYLELILADLANAEKSLQKAISLDETLSEPHYYLAVVYLEMGNSDAALSNLDLAAALGWSDEIALAEKKALAFTQKNDFAKAAAEYEKVLAEQDNFSPAFLVKPMWLWLEKLQEPEKALTPTATLLQNYPQDALAHLLRGRVFFETGDFEKAKGEYDHALALDSNLSEIYLYLGDWVLVVEKNKEEARNYYKQAFQMDPSSETGEVAAERYNNIRY